jgi:hypothetical protein
MNFFYANKTMTVINFNKAQYQELNLIKTIMLQYIILKIWATQAHHLTSQFVNCYIKLQNQQVFGAQPFSLFILLS